LLEATSSINPLGAALRKGYVGLTRVTVGPAEIYALRRARRAEIQPRFDPPSEAGTRSDKMG
jgi:hypothetical protein